MYNPLQVVAFDVPFPPNYGGAIDVYFRLKALHKLGVPLHLHAFRYRDRQTAPELRKICKEVHYYDRPFRIPLLFNRLPFIVATRMPEALLARLSSGPDAILFEGIHTCGFIDHPSLSTHWKLVRMHNAEGQYYRNLVRLQQNPLKAWHFRQEAKKIEAFERTVMEHAQVILPISTKDEQYFKTLGAHAELLPAFHGREKPHNLEGQGEYILFHGNLGVRDNEEAALFLIRRVLKDKVPPLVIAGRNPSSRLRRICAGAAHIMLAENPSQEEMEDLIRQAHINLLYSFQPDGIKIKLLHALFEGRHVVANSAMVKGTGLEQLCIVADEPVEIRAQVARLMRVPFDKKQRKIRGRTLGSAFADSNGAREVVSLAGL